MLRDARPKTLSSFSFRFYVVFINDTMRFPMYRLPVELRVKIYEYAHLDTIRPIACNRPDDTVEPWYQTILLAGILNDIEALELAAIQGEDQREVIMDCMAYTGNLYALKWAKEQDYPFSFTNCTMAAKGGHIDILKWLREQNCPWDEETCLAAANAGQLGTLKWLHEQGCPLGDIYDYCHVSLEAAGDGTLEILQYLVDELRVPMDAQMYVEAAAGGHLDILTWIRAIDFCNGSEGWWGGHFEV